MAATMAGKRGTSAAGAAQGDKAAPRRGVPVRLASVRVRVDGLDAIVMSPAGVNVSGDAARRADAAFPNLVNHVCVSGDAQRFGQSMIGASPAHLVEHIAIELMVQAAKLKEQEGSPGAADDLGASIAQGSTFTGHTSALNRAETDSPEYDPYQVSVTYESDLIAIRALRYACDIATWILAATDDAQNGADAGVPSFAGVYKDLARLYD